jgi:hypothetical protein
MAKRTFKKNILDIGNGMVSELANDELKKVLANIVDPNTDYKKMRKITLELKFKPNEDRSQITIEVSSKNSLAPNKPQKVTLFNTPTADPETGEIKTMLREVTSVPPGQMSLDGTIVQPETFLIDVEQ